MSSETFDPLFVERSQRQGTVPDVGVGPGLSLEDGALSQTGSTPGELARDDEPNRSGASQEINDAPSEDLADPDVQLDVYAREVPGLIKEGKGYRGLCPFHNDHQPSFRIDLKNGKWVWFCHPCAALEGGPVGGNAYELLKRLGKLPKPGNGEEKKNGDATAVYHYTDADGKLLFQVLRYGEGRGKTFKQRRPNGNGSWEWSVPEELRTLYNLPAVTKVDQVLIVEGEKDVDTARKLGFVATTNPGGATKWLPRYSELLAGKDVIIIPDADAAGDKHRRTVLKSLCESTEHPRSIKVIKLPAGKDLTEWIQSGGDAKQLTDLAQKADKFAYVDADSGEFVFGKIEEPEPEYGIVVLCKSDYHGVEYRKWGFEVLPWDKNDEERLAKELAGKNVVLTFQNEAVVALLQPEAQSLKVVASPPKSAEQFLELVETAAERRVRLVVSNADEFLKKEIKPREVLMQTKAEVPIFYAQSINQIFAWRGLGKTYLALGIVSGLVRGGKFLSWSAKRPVKVLYVEGEIPEYQMQERLRQVVGPSDGNLRIITLDEQPENEIPSLSTAYGRKLVEEAIGDAEVLVLDSISTLFNFSTNEEEHWLDVMAWLKKLRSKGLCIIFLHHAGKSGLQRGSSKSEDLLDVSIKLERPSSYHQNEGLRVNLRFDKTRGVAMVDGEVEVTMTIDNDRAEFLYGAIKESAPKAERYAKAVELFEKYPRATLVQLEEISGIPDSTLERYKKEWLAAKGDEAEAAGDQNASRSEPSAAETDQAPKGKKKRV